MADNVISPFCSPLHLTSLYPVIPAEKALLPSTNIGKLATVLHAFGICVTTKSSTAKSIPFSWESSNRNTKSKVVLLPGFIVLVYSTQPSVFGIPPVDWDDKATPELFWTSTVREASGWLFPFFNKFVAAKVTLMGTFGIMSLMVFL